MKTYYLREWQKGSLPFAIHFENGTPQYQKPHRHDCYEIMFIHSGFGWCSVNEKHYTIFPGDLFFMGKADIHEFMLYQTGTYYNVMFLPEDILMPDIEELKSIPFYKNFGQKEFSFPGKCIFPLHNHDRLENFLSTMLCESREGGPGIGMLQRAHLYELLVAIGRYASFFRTTEKDSSRFLAGKITNYILAHYQEKITLEALAKRFGGSPEYIGKYFQRHTGMAFTSYLAYVRVERARIFLESKDLSITDIAYRTGFFDQAHFTKVFKKITGMLPSEFRKKLIW